jgi:hypothetical protein
VFAVGLDGYDVPLDGDVLVGRPAWHADAASQERRLDW